MESKVYPEVGPDWKLETASRVPWEKEGRFWYKCIFNWKKVWYTLLYKSFHEIYYENYKYAYISIFYYTLNFSVFREMVLK